MICITCKHRHYKQVDTRGGHHCEWVCRAGHELGAKKCKGWVKL